MAAVYGVNRESTDSHFPQWGTDKTYGATLQAIVKLVDENSIKITISDKIIFEDKDDRQGPASQQAAAANALKDAKVDASKLTTILMNIETALKATPSRYSLTGVIEPSKTQGLILAQIMALEGKTGDILIAALLTALSIQDDSPYLTEAATKEKELKTVIDASPAKTAVEIQAAVGALISAKGYNATLYGTIITAANGAIAKQEAAEKAAAECIETQRIQELIAGVQNGTTSAAAITPDKNKIAAALPTDQSIIFFNDKGNSVQKYLLIQKEGNGYRVSSDPTPGITYKIRIDRDGKPRTVRKSGGKFPNLLYPSNLEILSTNTITGAKQPDSASALAVLAPNHSRLSVTTRNGTIYIDFIDTDKDGKFDRNEQEGATIYFTDNAETRYQKKLSAALFRVIDRDMDAKASDDLDSRDVITQNELEGALVIMQAYAEEAGSSLEEAVTAYATASAFHNIDFSGARSAREKVSAWLTGVDMADDAAIRKALESHVDSHILANLVLYLGRLRSATPPETVSAEAIARYLFRSAMASMGGEGAYDALGFVTDSAERNNLAALSRFNPDKVNEKTLLAWWEAGEVEEEGSGGGTHCKTQVAAIDKEKDPIRKLDLALEYMQSISGDVPALEEFYTERISGRKKINELENDPRALNILFEAYLGAGNLDKAREIANKCQNQDTKAQMLEKLVTKYADSVETTASGNEVRQTALTLIDQIIMELNRPAHEFQALTRANSRTINASEYKKMLEVQIAVPLDLVKIQKAVLPGGVLIIDSNTITNKITALGSIIDTSTSNDNNKKAHALAIKAEILAAQADTQKNIDPKTALELAFQAQTAYKEALDLFKKISGGNSTLYSAIVEKVTLQMMEVYESFKGLESDLKTKAEISEKGKTSKLSARQVIDKLSRLLPDTLPNSRDHGQTITKKVYKESLGESRGGDRGSGNPIM